jgi:hypothetical protein
VSNVNGNPMEKDGNGYISKLYKNGKVSKNKFIEGLNAPKGMVIIDNILYVTDIDRVMGFELPNGKKTFEYDLVNKSKFLNDICYDGSDNLYVSATDINEIFEINIKNKSIRNLGLADRINGPNGLIFHDGILYLCELGDDKIKGTLKSIQLFKDSSVVTTLTDYRGLLDGLSFYNNKLYFSDWVNFDANEKPAEIMVFDLDSKLIVPIKTNENMSGCADFFLDEKTKTIIAPLMREDKLLFVPL